MSRIRKKRTAGNISHDGRLRRPNPRQGLPHSLSKLKKIIKHKKDEIKGTTNPELKAKLEAKLAELIRIKKTLIESLYNRR